MSLYETSLETRRNKRQIYPQDNIVLGSKIALIVVVWIQAILPHLLNSD